MLPRTHPEVIRSRKTKKSPCKHHPEKEYFTYCTKCKAPCCPICAIKDHSGHSFSDFEDAAEEARVAIESKIDNLETSLHSSELKRHVVEDGISSYNKSVEQAVEKSKARFKILREEIDRAEHDWMKEMQETKNTGVTNMKEIKTALDKQIKETMDSKASCKRTLEISSHLELLSHLSKYKDLVSPKLLEITLPALVYFNPSEYKFPSISELVGIRMPGKRRTLLTPSQVKELDKSKAVEQFQSHMISVKQERALDIGRGKVHSLLHNDQNDVFINTP